VSRNILGSEAISETCFEREERLINILSAISGDCAKNRFAERAAS
jgi:hypothetical protein